MAEATVEPRVGALLRDWRQRRRLSQLDLALEAVQREVDDANEQMARVEQIKKWKLLPVEWQPGGEELTPTMKLKRKPIAEKYKGEIEELYSG